MSAEIIHGDCRELLASVPVPSLMLTDPPYGISVQTNYRERQRTALAMCNNFAPIIGDDKPFDPGHLIATGWRMILFGANHYAERLPSSPSWIIWDKLDGLTSKREFGFNDQADCEIAWTNLGGPARVIPHRWMGAMKGSEHTERRVHPTQKPVWLMARLIEQFTKPGDLVFDPYAGSGSTGVACVQTGRRFIGVEREAAYVEIARRRIAEAQSQLTLGVA